ncbi:hypothetical protein MLD38_029756 [Melastoma candidum]|uniref:Uncharacterized protein n=1 Tax=Melastoma candidum TaxID=119954 RepID=A0ACB9N755_9MYRT|nr:hypothetical protein MLD38_029756 [Melastoma candidum]
MRPGDNPYLRGKERLRWAQDVRGVLSSISAAQRLNRGRDEIWIPCSLFDVLKFVVMYSSRGNSEGDTEGHGSARAHNLSCQESLTFSAAQLMEAIQVQMEYQNRLFYQLEIRKILKQNIEAQGRYLEKLVVEQHKKAKTTKLLFTNPTSLLSLYDEPDSNAKDLADESDSEGNGSNLPTSPTAPPPPSPPPCQDNLIPLLPPVFTTIPCCSKAQ